MGMRKDEKLRPPETPLRSAVDPATWQLYKERGLGSNVGFGSKAAVLVVDMSKAFTDPRYRVGSDQTPEIEAIRTLLRATRLHGAPVFFTTMAYRVDGRDAGLLGAKMPMVLDLRVNDRAAVEIDDRIAPTQDDIVINKKFPSAFFGTPLASLLMQDRVDTIILTGCSTSGCIRATAVDGISHGFHVIVPQECVGDRALGPHYASLFDIAAKYGDVVSLSDVVAYFSVGPSRVSTQG